MERLTERDEYGNAEIIALSDVMPELYAGLSFEETNALTEALNRLAAYEDTGLAPERVTELARAEKDGRLVVLPCKVGTEIWTVVTKRPKVSVPEFSFIKRSRLTWNNMRAVLQGFGKTDFLTREEAEAALKKREADNETD